MINKIDLTVIESTGGSRFLGLGINGFTKSILHHST